MTIPRDLLIGDVLLYRGHGWFSRIIAFKTWSRVTHVEVYDGRLKSVASREGQGVGRYDYRADGLVMVLRPKGPFNYRRARQWFTAVDGQPYDWIGLLNFGWAKRQGRENGAQFCSEFATRFLRAGGIDPFNGYDADGLAPGEFAKSLAFDHVWTAA